MNERILIYSLKEVSEKVEPLLRSPLLPGEKMEVESTGDLVRCPSCHEMVPKTLYCLNCGYPLYKVEFEEEEATEEENVEMKAEEEAEREEAPLEEAEEKVEEEGEEGVEEETAEVIEAAEEGAEIFTPPPPLEEVMREVAKNLSIRMRMVKMLLNGEMREEAFKRLLDHYVERSERWLSERRGLLERRRVQLEELEEKLMEAKMKLEELEIRRAIGDASEEEYEVKAPAYRWDVEKLGDEAERLKAEIDYLKGLSKAMGMNDEELESSIGEMMKNLEGLLNEGSITQETYEKAKGALEEILDILKG